MTDHRTDRLLQPPGQVAMQLQSGCNERPQVPDGVPGSCLLPAEKTTAPCPKGKGDCAEVQPDKRCFDCTLGVRITDPYCGHMKRGVRKVHCPRCMRAAYPGIPFKEAQRRFIDASGVTTEVPRG